MKKHSRRPSLAALCLAAPLLAWGQAAAAATFTVLNLADSGPGSLRQAVLDANAATGADEVAFAPGLTGTITLTSGEIAISGPLVVQGPGAPVLTVSGNDEFRIFRVENAAARPPIAVTLSGLTLTHGRGFPAPSFSFGGAVFSIGEDLTILNCVVSDSQAGFQFDPPFVGCGGNVALLGSSGGSLRIADSRLTGGSVLGFGSESGGNLCVIGGRLVLERSTLSGGSASFGGGLYVEALAEDSSVLLSTVSGNGADTFGGGIYTASLGGPGVLTIESSTISGNTAEASGLGGGLAIFGSEVRIVASTISGNDADFGGGILGEGGTVRVLNSTVSGNHASHQAGGILYSESVAGSLVLRLSTLSGNSAGATGGGLVVAGPSAAAVVQLDHSILANGTPQDLAGYGGTPANVTANYTLIEAPSNTLLVGANNHLGIDPLLGPLASNGGPTRTHRLLPGSPALEAGNPAIPDPPPTDQRGATRIVGPAVDLGSVEGILGITEVPALTPAGLLVLCALLLAAGVRRLRRA